MTYRPCTAPSRTSHRLRWHAAVVAAALAVTCVQAVAATSAEAATTTTVFTGSQARADGLVSEDDATSRVQTGSALLTGGSAAAAPGPASGGRPRWGVRKLGRLAARSTSPSLTAATMPPLRISPGGTGTRDGSSWKNAGDLSDLPRFVAARPAGGEIWVRADAGPYRPTTSISLKAGGSVEAPVVIRGVAANGTATARPVVVGTRTAPYVPGGSTGREVFKLYSGARNLTFSNLSFLNEGTVFNAGGNASNITIVDVSAVNVRRFFTNYLSSGESTANVQGLTMRRVKVNGFSKSVLNLGSDSSRVLLEDVVGDSQRQDRDDFAMGIHLEDTVHDVTLRRVTMRNAHDSLHDYWNGDGFATERDVYDVRLFDTLATGNTDGGYDLKSTRTTLVNARAEDNKRNFRFWAPDTRVVGCTGRNPHKRGGSSSQTQVWAASNATVRLSGCTFTDASAQTIAFELGAGARVIATTTTVSRSPLSRLAQLASGSSLELS